MGNILGSCLGSNEEEKDPLYYINNVDDIIKAIDMRLKKCKYEITQHEIKARGFAIQNEKQRAISELSSRNEKQKNYNNWLQIHENVVLIRNRMDESVSITTLVDSYKEANKFLAETNKKLKSENVEKILDDLAEHSTEIEHTNSLLAGDFLAKEVDVEQEYNDLFKSEEIQTERKQIRENLITKKTAILN